MAYTFKKLIKGNRFSAAYHAKQIRDIERKPVNNRDAESLDYHRHWLSYFDDELARYRLALACCGNETVIIR